MPFIIVCPSCGLQGSVPDGTPAQMIRCPQCGTEVSVSGNGAPRVPAEAAHPMAGRLPSHALDSFFAQVGAQQGAAVPAPLPDAPLPPPPLPTSTDGPPADSKAEQEWVLEEKRRLEAYMERQFAVLRQQREEFSRWRSEVEAALVGREQELNRQTKQLEARAGTLDQLEVDRASRAAAAAAALVQAAAVEQRLQDLRNETEIERRAVQDLRAEAERLQSTDADCQHRAAEIEECFLALQQGEQSLRDDKGQFELRFAELELAEQALQRRINELERLEEQVRRELEAKERRLEERAQELDRPRQHPAAPQQSGAEASRLRQAQEKQAAEFADREQRSRQELQQREEQLAQARLELGKVQRQAAELGRERDALRQTWDRRIGEIIQQREDRFRQELDHIRQQQAEALRERDLLRRKLVNVCRALDQARGAVKDPR